MTPDPIIFQAIPIGYGIAVFVMGIVLATTLALLGYFIRDLKQAMTAKDTSHDHAIEKLNDLFNEFQVHSAETYITREDFVRSLIKLEAKIDDQGRVLRSVARDLNQVIGERGAPHVPD